MTSWKKLGPILFFTYFNSSSHNPTFLKVNQRQSWISIFCYFCQIPLRNFLWTPNFAFYVSLVIYKYPYCHQIYLQNLKLFPTTVISELPLCLVAATFFLQNYFSRDKGISGWALKDKVLCAVFPSLAAYLDQTK